MKNDKNTLREKCNLYFSLFTFHFSFKTTTK